MNRSRVGLIVGPILVLAAALGCGTSDANRVLQSITITPRSAVANGQQVQFTATGTFSKPPSPASVPFVAPYSAGWQSSDLAIATIDQNGMAKCNTAGTTAITATASANSCTKLGCMSVGVSGTATLTCP